MKWVLFVLLAGTSPVDTGLTYGSALECVEAAGGVAFEYAAAARQNSAALRMLEKIDFYCAPRAAK